jgi:hypothetical protein
MKLTVTSAQNYDKKKDGTAMLDGKTGRQKYRSVIKTVERGEEMLSGFVFKPIKAGDVIEADLKPDTYNGVTRMQFSIIQTTQEKVQGAQTGEVIVEMKNHTVFLKQILTTLEDIRIALATHQTIESMKKPPTAPTKEPLDTFDENIGELHTEALPVLDEEDFGNPFE